MVTTALCELINGLKTTTKTIISKLFDIFKKCHLLLLTNAFLEILIYLDFPK